MSDDNEDGYNPYTNWRLYLVLCYLAPFMAITEVMYRMYLVKEYLKRKFK